MDQRSEWTQLSASVERGELWLEPGVAKQCADRCQRHVDELRQILVKAEYLGHADGYGDLPSGKQLGEKFKQLAVGDGPYYDLKQLLQDRMKVAGQMRDTFLKIHERYGEAESANKQGLRTAGGGV